MSSNSKFLPLIMVGVLLMAACDQAKKQEQPAAGQKLSGMVEQVEKEASSMKTKAEKQVEKSEGALKDAANDVAAAKDATMSKLKELIEKAKKLLAENKFEEAISAAQSALALDGNSQEAKDIITKAKEKIKAMAGETMDGLKEGVGDKFKSFGQ